MKHKFLSISVSIFLSLIILCSYVVTFIIRATLWDVSKMKTSYSEIIKIGQEVKQKAISFWWLDFDVNAMWVVLTLLLNEKPERFPSQTWWSIRLRLSFCCDAPFLNGMLIAGDVLWVHKAGWKIFFTIWILIFYSVS